MVHIAGVVAIYALTVLFLIVLMMDTSLRLWLKVTTILVGFIAVGSSYGLVTGLLGWPIAAPPPERFQLLATHVQDPDKTTGAEGVVYLWLAEINADNLEVSPPRSFITPFTDDSAEKATKAQEMINVGERVVGEVKTEPAAQGDQQAAERSEQEDESGTVFSGILGPIGEPAYIDFMSMPSVVLPPKE